MGWWFSWASFNAASSRHPQPVSHMCAINIWLHSDMLTKHFYVLSQLSQVLELSSKVVVQHVLGLTPVLSPHAEYACAWKWLGQSFMTVGKWWSIDEFKQLVSSPYIVGGVFLQHTELPLVLPVHWHVSRWELCRSAASTQVFCCPAVFLCHAVN